MLLFKVIYFKSLSSSVLFLDLIKSMIIWKIIIDKLKITISDLKVENKKLEGKGSYSERLDGWYYMEQNLPIKSIYIIERSHWKNWLIDFRSVK